MSFMVFYTSCASKVIPVFLLLACFSCNRDKNGDRQITMGPKSAVRDYGGTYTFGKNPEKEAVGILKIYPESDSTALFFLDICIGPPSYTMGKLSGRLKFRNNTATYHSGHADKVLDCALKFNFGTKSVTIKTQKRHDDCGFGHHVSADGAYRLTDASIPEYYINGDGDSILFENYTENEAE